jgi:pyruvate-formate lyase-activating enzyme
MAILILTLKVKTTGRAFYCNSLQGESDFNITINADMTVSCNCQDYDGKGQIGDLREQDLGEIFSNTRASRLRKELASGRIPLSVCYSCQDLRISEKRTIKALINEYKTPKKAIQVENTAVCNLKCLSCHREIIAKTRRRMTMSKMDIEKVALTVRNYGIKKIAFFNLGEPFLAPRVAEDIDVLRRHNPYVYISTATNGIYLDTIEKREAALKLDIVSFSIDGVTQEQLVKYQVGGDFAKSYYNMKELVAFRNNRGLKNPVIEWKYVLFKWNDTISSIEEAVRLAKDAGVDIISFWPGGINLSRRTRRFYTDPYFKSLGSASWKGREIDFRSNR